MKTPLLLVLAAALCAVPVSARAADLSGEWTFEVSTSQGSGSPTFVLKQDGEKLTGTYRGLLGEADLTGTVAGNKLKFSFTGKAQGNEFTVTYDGEIENEDSVKGTVDLAGMASGTFTGKRKKK
jgi:hypothetical protein